MDIIELHSNRLFLRTFQRDDISLMFPHIQNNFELTKFMTWNPPKTIEESYKIFDAKNEKNPYDFSLFYEDQFVGRIVIKEILRKDNDANIDLAEIGYWLSEKFQMKGIMSEAVSVISKFCFTQLALRKIITYSCPENISFCRVLEKNGFRKVGILKDDIEKDGRIWDVYLYELLSSEFIKKI